MNPTNELKSCPFCNHIPQIVEIRNHSNAGKPFKIWHGQSFCPIKETICGSYASKERAIDFWNLRTPSPSVKENDECEPNQHQAGNGKCSKCGKSYKDIIYQSPKQFSGYSTETPKLCPHGLEQHYGCDRKEPMKDNSSKQADADITVDCSALNKDNSSGEVKELAEKIIHILSWKAYSEPSCYTLARELIINEGYSKSKPQSEAGLVPLDKEEFINALCIFHDGNPAQWFAMLERIWTEKFSKFGTPPARKMPSSVDLIDEFLKCLGIRHSDLSIEQRDKLWSTVINLLGEK